MVSFIHYNKSMRIINPLKKYETLEKACGVLGFDIEIPPRYKLIGIYVISNSVLELRFSSVIVRKAKYDKNIIGLNGISGTYNGAYPNNCIKQSFKLDSKNGSQFWNGSTKNPKAYLSFWDDLEHGFSYSVYAKKGISLKSMTNWQEKLK